MAGLDNGSANVCAGAFLRWCGGPTHPCDSWSIPPWRLVACDSRRGGCGGATDHRIRARAL